MREFVGEDEPQPVVGLADVLDAGRPDRGHDDRVVGKRRRESVGQLGLVDEDDVGMRRRLHAGRAVGEGHLHRLLLTDLVLQRLEGQRYTVRLG